MFNVIFLNLDNDMQRISFALDTRDQRHYVFHMPQLGIIPS